MRNFFLFDRWRYRRNETIVKKVKKKVKNSKLLRNEFQFVLKKQKTSKRHLLLWRNYWKYVKRKDIFRQRCCYQMVWIPRTYTVDFRSNDLKSWLFFLKLFLKTRLQIWRNSYGGKKGLVFISRNLLEVFSLERESPVLRTWLLYNSFRFKSGYILLSLVVCFLTTNKPCWNYLRRRKIRGVWDGCFRNGIAEKVVTFISEGHWLMFVNDHCLDGSASTSDSFKTKKKQKKNR